jgi:hypothetical protein
MWVKILVALLVVGLIGLVVIYYLAVAMVKDLISEDPAKVAAKAKDVAVISDPLPGSFKWKRVIDMRAMGDVLTAEAGDGQAIVLTNTLTAEKDAQTMMHDSSHYGLGAKMVSVDEKGTDTVGGQPMQWELGTIDQEGAAAMFNEPVKKGKQCKGFIGVVVIKSKSKTVFVIGVQPTGPYNLPETKQFLSGIQSF